MNNYTLMQLRQGVAQYLGLGTFPTGNQQGYDASIQSAIEYCWRFTNWPFVIRKDAHLTQANDDTTWYMPHDFDAAGWREFKGTEEWSIEDAHRFEMEQGEALDGCYLEYDQTKNNYKVIGDVDEDTLVSYSVLPPLISERQSITFPQAQPIVIVASIYQKMKEHPNSADIRQEWNMADTLLAKLAYNFNKNTPLHRPRTRYDQFMIYPGEQL